MASSPRAVAIAISFVIVGCGADHAAPRPIRVLHTFGAGETELFNAAMVERGIAVESLQVPFSRGQHVIGELLRAAGANCPDVIRIDATWLPELVDANLLRPVPAELTALDWSPIAAVLGRAGTPPMWWGVPQATDGLMVVRDAQTPAPAAPTTDRPASPSGAADGRGAATTVDRPASPSGAADGRGAATTVDRPASPSGAADGRGAATTVDPSASPSGAADGRGAATTVDPSASPSGAADGRGAATTVDPSASPSGAADGRGAATTVEALAATGATIGVRVDGYWLVPWLRADGVSLTGSGADAIAGIDGPGAVDALASFAALFAGSAAPPPAAGDEPPDELRRWRAHSIAYWVTGPWQLGALTPAERDRVVVTALVHAPRGGQLMVVPTCAPHPDDGWRIARALSEPALQLAFATEFATIPTRLGAIAAAPAIVKDEYAALLAAEPLPLAAWTPLLFDDLNPALAAVVAGDATADEAIVGVRKAWRGLAGARP